MASKFRLTNGPPGTTSVALPASVREALSSFSDWPADEQIGLVLSLLSQMEHCNVVEVSAALAPVLRRDFIAGLPGELAEKILGFLDASDLCNAELVSRTWKNIIEVHLSWRKLLEQRASDEQIWRDMCFYKQGDIEKAMQRQLSWKELFGRFHLDIARVRHNWQTGHCTKTEIECQGNGIYCLQYDHKKIVSGSRDNTIKIWDLSSHRCTRTFAGHSGSVLCLQFDERKIISGSSDTTIRIWEMRTGKCLHVIKRHTQSVLHLRVCGNRLVTCSKDKTVMVWDITETDDPYTCKVQHVRTLTGHKAAVNVVEVDEHHIVSASGDRTIKVWNTQTGDLVATLQNHERGIACLQYKGNYIVSGSSDKTIKVWDVRTGECLRTLEGHTDLVRCVRFNEDYIVSGSYDNMVRVWDFATGEQLYELEGHSNRVFRVQFDSFKIISSSQDDFIRIWDFMNV